MKLCKISLLSLSVMSLAACHQKAAAPVATADTVATVNGTPISRNLYNSYVKQALQGKDPTTLTQPQKDEALDNLVRAELVVQQAETSGLTKDAQTADLIELSRMNAVQQAFSENFVKENKPTEEELKKEYDVQVALLPHTEYHVEHVLVSTQDAASKIIADLGKGAKFEDLSKKFGDPKDPSSQQGGDLGFFKKGDMLPEFSNVAFTLKPNEYTKTPVHTRYGWHVIQVLETKVSQPPTYDQVHDEIKQELLRKDAKAFVEQARAQVKVQLFNANGTAVKPGGVPTLPPAPPAAPAAAH